jgi:hypothetical protein
MAEMTMMTGRDEKKKKIASATMKDSNKTMATTGTKDTHKTNIICLGRRLFSQRHLLRQAQKATNKDNIESLGWLPSQVIKIPIHKTIHSTDSMGGWLPSQATKIPSHATHHKTIINATTNAMRTSMTIEIPQWLRNDENKTKECNNTTMTFRRSNADPKNTTEENHALHLPKKPKWLCPLPRAPTCKRANRKK